MSQKVEAKSRDCRKCGKEFPYTKGWRICTECLNAYMKTWRKNYESSPARVAYKAERKANPNWVEKERKRGRDYWKNLRHLALMAYGGYKCACCGETESKFLTLDHAMNDGSEHRKMIGNRGAGIFSWLKKHNYPAGFQVLCFNCNCGRALNKGVCPHETRSEHEELRENGGNREPAIPCQAQKWEGVTTIPQGSTAK